MKAKELHRILSQALLFAGKDDTLPMLCGVKLVADGERLWAAATDRFTIGVGHTEYTDGKFDLFLNRVTASNVIKLAKGGVRDERTVTINADDGSVSFEFSDGGVVRATVEELEFPKVGQLFEPERVEFDEVGFNPAFIERIGKAAKISAKGPLVWRFNGEAKPAVAYNGDFAALIMPVRLFDSNRGVLPASLKEAFT